MKSIFGYLLACSMFLISSDQIFAQNLEVDGKAKVTDLATDNSANQVVVVLDDGTFGTRDAATLGGSATSPFIVGGGSANNGFDDGTNNFVPMASSTVRGASSTLADTRVPMNGVISGFEGAINGATSTANYTFTVYKGGNATGVTCTITQGSSTCLDLINSVQFFAGERISVLYVGDDTGGAANDNRFGRWVAIFTPGGTIPD